MSDTAAPAARPLDSARRFRLSTPLVACVALLALLLVMMLALMWWWDKEPAQFDPMKLAAVHASPSGVAATGVVTTATLIESMRVLLDKRGGYLSNDHLPPGAWMDNIPNWEFGSLTASRDLVRALRNDFSRSQTQSTEDPGLAEADPLLSSPNDRWLFPSSESQYRKGMKDLQGYLDRLDGNDSSDSAYFYARADNLADYLQVVSARLGSLSQRLSASVGQPQLVQVPAGAVSVAPTGAGRPEKLVKTPWNRVDDNFYEARGYTWTLLEQLKAIQHDFAPILRSKHADVSLQQVIRELEESQKPLGSPIVLNGRPFGFFGNHSLVMANYVSRANAAIIDLRELLKRG